jgi:hypothetical protein
VEGAWRDDEPVPLPADRLHPVYGPLLALLLVAVLSGLLWWTFGTQNDHRAPERDPSGDYGLLREVALVPTPEAAAVLHSKLAADGIRATVNPAGADGGHRILVFEQDEVDALLVLARRD